MRWDIFLWLYALLARDGHVALDEPALDVLALVPRYLAAIRYWQDEDSGHWEETRKISASSIGTVVAASRRSRCLFAIGPTRCALSSSMPALSR